MNKQSLMLSALLLTSSGLYAVTANEVLQKFNASFGGLFGQGELFNKKINISQQNSNINAWNAAIDAAKSFVIDNCKNLVGIKDSDLTNPIRKIENANNDLINAIKITRNVSSNKDLNKQADIFKKIEREMDTLAKQVKSMKFNMDKKKEAQEILYAVATYIESAANKTFKEVSLSTSIPTDMPPVYEPAMPSDMPPVFEEYQQKNQQRTSTQPTKPAKTQPEPEQKEAIPTKDLPAEFRQMTDDELIFSGM
jgi:hypothetical protein